MVGGRRGRELKRISGGRYIGEGVNYIYRE